MNIRNFSPGDRIIRVDPAKPYCTGVRDRSYMDEKLFFIGIQNGNIHFQRTDDFALMALGDIIYSLPLNLWDEGWETFVRRNFKFGR